MAHSLPYRILTAHRDIFAYLDEVFTHIDGVFGPKNTFLAVMALKAAHRSVNYRDVLKEMHQEWQWLGWESTPSAGALSKARAHLDVDDCREVWQEAVTRAQASAPPRVSALPGRRVYAFDGCRVVSPGTAGARKRWGCPTDKDGKKHHNPQSLMVAAWEITTGIPLDIALLGYKGSERLGAQRILSSLKKGDVAVFDRGFHGREFFSGFLAHGVDIVARMTAGAETAWKEIEPFLSSKEDDAIVNVDLGDGIGKRLMRLVRRRFLPGAPKKGQPRDKMIIMTTLLDQEAYPLDVILDLYSRRWDIETRFREMKHQFGLESFHSNRVDGIEQEIYAVLTWMTLSAMVQVMAEKAVDKKHGYQEWMDPHMWQVSRPDVFSATRRLFFAVLVDPRAAIDNLVELAQGEADWIATGARRRRPGRSFKRETKRPWGRWA
jgi:hypothetical protein